MKLLVDSTLIYSSSDNDGTIYNDPEWIIFEGMQPDYALAPWLLKVFWWIHGRQLIDNCK